MYITVSLVFIAIAIVIAIWHGVNGKAPLWVAVLCLCIAMLLWMGDKRLVGLQRPAAPPVCIAMPGGRRASPMTVLNVGNTLEAGRPVQVFDADGKEITYCLQCDTETGEVTRYRIGADGQYETDENGDVYRERVFAKAPLTVTPVQRPQEAVQ